jgi:hypothetical protein
MLVDFALEAERHEGMSPEQAIYRACTLRFRPILMTTMAALLGGVPLMLGTPWVWPPLPAISPCGFGSIPGFEVSDCSRLAIMKTPGSFSIRQSSIASG